MATKNRTAKYRTATLMVRLTDHSGKRRYCSPAYPAKGTLPKPQRAIVDGVEGHYPDAVYVLRYPTPDGKRVWETVGKDPDAAVARMEDRNYTLRKEDRGELAPVLKPGKPKPVEDDPNRKRLDLQAEQWLRETAAQTCESTTYIYATVMKSFRAHCTKRYLDELTREDITAYLTKLKDDGAADRTRYNHAMHLRTFFRWAGYPLLIEGKNMPRFNEKVVSAYSDDELRRMRELATEEERLWLDWMVSTGLREQEAMYGTWDDIDFDHSILVVRAKPEFAFKPKDRSDRYVPIPSAMLVRMAERQKTATSRLLWPSARGGPDGHMLRVIKRLYQAAGLNCGSCRTKPRNGDRAKSCATHPVCRKAELHKLRKSYATRLHRQAVPILTISKLLGHSEIETTLRYLESADLRSKQTIEQVSRCFDFAA